MFPELFGLTNLRLRYNWYGGGNRQKSELCRERKALIQRYVTFYYPEIKGEQAFKERVVPKVNELLRRRVRDKKEGTDGGHDDDDDDDENIDPSDGLNIQNEITDMTETTENNGSFMTFLNYLNN